MQTSFIGMKKWQQECEVGLVEKGQTTWWRMGQLDEIVR